MLSSINMTRLIASTIARTMSGLLLFVQELGNGLIRPVSSMTGSQWLLRKGEIFSSVNQALEP